MRRSSDELHSEYVADDHLQLSAWARDAFALELPEQILCREDCAGLCPGVREGPERGAARALGARARPALGRAGGAQREP